MRKLSVGYLVDAGYQPDLVYDLIAKSRHAEHYSIDYLVVQTFDDDENPPTRARKYLKRGVFLQAVARVCLAGILALERRVFVRNAELKSTFALHHLDTFDLKKIYVHPLKSTRGLVYRYGQQDLQTIKSLNVDVLLRGGSGILRGEVLTVCAFGIISLQLADNHKLTGGPPGFWEVFNREPSTGFFMQRLRQELGDDVLMRGSIATASNYALNLARLYKKSNILTHRFLEGLGRTRTLPQTLPDSSYAYKPYTAPSVHVVALYQIKTFTLMARRLLNKGLGRYQRWGVAYQYVENWRSSVLSKSHVISNSPHRFLADPFVFRSADLDVCFVEDYDFGTRKGKISAFKVGDNEYAELGVALEEPFHLSFPFIFTAGSELYMCPETADIREVRLYKCGGFPLRWHFYKTLIKDVSAVDTIIFRFEGRWWLLTNIDSADVGEHESELHVYYSEAFDSDAWTPHPNNPVIFDSERARNGGFFKVGEDLFRVFQIQGFALYGEAMGIARITELGTEIYDEETVRTIVPRFAPKIIGTHSFAYHNGLLAFDFLKVHRVRASG